MTVKKDIKGGKYFMDKKKLFTASLASVAVLGAGFIASHPSVVKAATVEELQKDAEAKDQALKDAEAKAQSEKQEAAAAAAAVEKAKADKLAADEALAKAKEEAAKEEEAKKEEAATKEDLSKALDQLEEAIANDPNITDKEAAKKAAKELVDKEGLLKAIEAGEIKASEILAELADDNEKAEANAPVTEAKPATKDTLPEGIKAGIEKAEKADAARPASEKAQDKADDLGEKADKLKKEAEADAKTAAEQAAALEKTNAVLKETKEAVKTAKENQESPDVIKNLEDAQKALEAKAQEQEAEATAAKESADARIEEANKLVDEYNAALKEVEAAKEKEAEEVEDAAIEALQSKVADLEKEVAELEKLVADNENNPDAVDYVTAAKEKLEDKKAELEKAETELEEALKGLEPKVESSNGQNAPIHNVPILKITRFVDSDNHEIAETVEGTVKEKDIPGYEFVNTTYGNGITTHIYKVKIAEPRPGGNIPDRGQDGSGQPAAPTGETPAPATPAHPMPAPAAPTGETPAPAATPAPTAPAVAGTSQDNTYQAPAAKAEDKKELPNTGGKDNAAIASLGFLGLLLGALPFVKRKN